MNRALLVSILLLFAAYPGCAIGEIPSAPVNIGNNIGNFWVNHTWLTGAAGSDRAYLISGEYDGVFYGFNWTGSTWQSDTVIVGGLGDVGYMSNPATFQKDSTWYLISGGDAGTFAGYNWTGSTWQSDTVIVGGLGDVGHYSAPTIFQKDGTWYLITGEYYGTFAGYNWTGSTWQSDTVIAGGLGDVGDRSTPTVFQKDSTWYLIAGEHNGVFTGYNWTGSTWQSDTVIAGGLGDVGDRSTPTVFQKDSTWYLITGEYDGVFYGFNWTGSTWQSDSEIVSGLGSIGYMSTPTTFTFEGWGNVTDSYNVSVNSVWYNTSPVYYNDTYSAHGWQNITVYAYNASGTGTLSTGNISQDTQIPNNPITITNTSDWSGAAGSNVYADYDATDADSDTPTFSCNRTDLFTDFDTATGEGNMTTISGSHIYYVNFGVSDGYGSTDNYMMTIVVIDLEAWWDGGWYNRERIEVNNTCGDNLNGFYVGIVLNTTQCAWGDCRDMRFCNPSNENVEYAWYTTSFNDGAPVYQENEVVYVRVPNLGENETAWIYFYYNNSQDVPSTCAGMGSTYYYENFDNCTSVLDVRGWEAYGNYPSTGSDGFGGKCIKFKHEGDFGAPWDPKFGWYNTYKFLIQPTATSQRCNAWIYQQYECNTPNQREYSYIYEVGWNAFIQLNYADGVDMWLNKEMSFPNHLRGNAVTVCCRTVGADNPYDCMDRTWFDEIVFYQEYPCEPSRVYYTRETKPSSYIVLYDSNKNLVRHAQVSIQNLNTGETVHTWQDVDEGIIDMGFTIDPFQVAVRTFDGVFVHTCDLGANPVCEIILPIHYNLKIHPVDQRNQPVFNVFAGLAEYTIIDPQAFWGMDLSDQGYVPVTNCSGFAMCDIIAEKEGYVDYKVEALNWTSKSAMIKDYRHNVVMEEE